MYGLRLMGFLRNPKFLEVLFYISVYFFKPEAQYVYTHVKPKEYSQKKKKKKKRNLQISSKILVENSTKIQTTNRSRENPSTKINNSQLIQIEIFGSTYSWKAARLISSPLAITTAAYCLESEETPSAASIRSM